MPLDPDSRPPRRFSSTEREAIRSGLLMLGVVLVLLALVYQGLEVVSGARAYVGGEGLWSKAQKDATYHLLLYARDRDPRHYAQFRAALAVPLGDRQARLELERPDPDYARVFDGFRQGRNHPDDWARMASFYHRFRHLSFVDRAIGIWNRGDGLIAELGAAGARLHAELQQPVPREAVVAAELERLDQLSFELGTLEDQFSRELGDGARWARKVIFLLISGAAAILMALAGVVTWRAMRRSVAAMASLRASEEEHRTLVDHARFGIYRATMDGRILRANPAMVRLLGYDSEEEVKALNIERDVYLRPTDRARLVTELLAERAPAGGSDVEWKRRDGSVILVRLSIRLLRDGRGEVEGTEAFVEDISERRALESRLRQAQKMEAVGQLTGGLAHDFNNLLTVILSAADLVEQQLPPGSDGARGDLAELKRSVRRGAEMIRRLLVFTRDGHVNARPMPLGDVVQAAAPQLREMLPATVEIRILTDPSTPQVRADPASIRQILLNLAANARDAMPEGGVLTIRTNSATRGGDDGRWAELVVEDTGIGMGPAVRERLFEPFFTTKPPGQGVGLGTAMVYGLVKQHGGEIDVTSAPGQGTTLLMRFPAADTEATAAPAEQPALRPGTVTVLVVDDEEALLRSARRILERQGYRVLVAADGEEALAKYDQHRDEIALVLSDVVMPRLGGPALHEALRARGAAVPLIFMSGYTGREMPDGVALPEGIPLLAKPWDVHELLLRVQEALGGGQADSA